tara:strand:- start:3515 stop:4645 length:1131 start_codon:yes stop_codon:yes gene_type:complete
MPSFKPKTNKEITTDTQRNITLDIKHNEFMKKFEHYETVKIPELQEKMNTYSKEISSYQESDPVFKKYQKNIAKIKYQIQKMKKEIQEYYLENSKYIFSYFEEKKTISEGTNKTVLLNNFFKKPKEQNNQNEHIKQSETDMQKYLMNINEGVLNLSNYVVQNDICDSCKQGEMVPQEHEGLLICNKCGVQKQYLIDYDKPSYKEPPKEVCFYAYKRINHFREIIAQFQAKETTQIPKEVMQNIKAQIKKERIDIKDIDNKKAKEILKKLGYNKYYEHIPFIKEKLGIKPPVMSPELEDKLCNLFTEIQRPYAKFCPDNRVNFLNYYYTVYKLCELLGETSFLSYFPMLKDRDKRIEQDEIWKKICNELNWEFIVTV